MNTHFKCIFSDLDKTLLSPTSEISEFTRETICNLASRGIDFVPSSGRAFNSLPKDLFSIDGIKYAVTSNGVSINEMKTGTPLSTMCIPKKDMKNLLHFIKPYDTQHEIFINGQGYAPFDYWNNPSIAGEKIPDRKKYVQSTRKRVDDFDSFLLENISKIEAFDIISNPDVIQKIMQDMEHKFPDIYITNSERYLIEFSNIESGKHKGMERCCKLLGINPKECVAFGDAINDVEMLKLSGLGIAVSNSMKECKDAADFVSEYSNAEDCVARELRKIFASYF